MLKYVVSFPALLAAVGNVGSVTTPPVIETETPIASGSLRGVRPAG